MKHQRRSYRELDYENPRESRDRAEVTLRSNISEPRRTRIERLETTESSSAFIPQIASDSHTTLRSLEYTSSRRREDRYRNPEESRHRRRRRSTIGDIEMVRSSRESIPEPRRLAADEESSESEDDAATQSGSIEETPARRTTRITSVTRPSGSDEPGRAETREAQDEAMHSEVSPRGSKAHRPRRAPTVEVASTLPPKRSVSSRHTPPVARPRLRRSHTTALAPKPHRTSAPVTTNATSRPTSFLGGLFGSAPRPSQHPPERLVECLTCLSDDIPKSKSAKLKCGHRMCHSCLKRIFKLSVTDPQHMPPKCCTADHIPLKHVDRLFDVNFKKTWNQKFQEYSTKNRIYCPARRCGEWIKPGDIHKEDGRKYGKCSRCKTKVCCLCNGKWHGLKDCPKDEATNQLLEAAKQAGWQRCYSCKTMVELKEGCNHMTCRCTAEFCMVCGVKWKTCTCPWFNYETVEEDRLNHMRVPGEFQEGDHRPIRVEPRPANYLEQIYQRRRQERVAEGVVRRIWRQPAVAIDHDDDYQGGIGDIHGIGNGAGHFMNEDYVRATDNNRPANMDAATAAASHALGIARARNPPPSGNWERKLALRPPLLRRHTMREQEYNSAPSTRPSERVVPRRVRNDYESEAAVHAPVTRTQQRPASIIGRPPPSRSIQAGLGGAGRGSHRVSAWRRHVEAGVEPEEGVISM